MKISIIMPFYNSEATISKSLKSIEQQTILKYNNIILNIVCVNNNSTDNSFNICNEYLNSLKINGKKTLINCNIKGVVPARNSAIYECFKNDFDYIASLDSDDQWLPEKLEKQIDYINNNKCDIIGTQILYINDMEEIFHKSNYPTEDKDIKKHIKQGINPIANSSSLIKKDVFLQCGSYDPTYNLCEDFHFWIKASKWFNFYNISEYLTKYRFVKPNKNYVNDVGIICSNHFQESIRRFHNE
jgi:glycosyltransferase involved in cell wall biosynthesis